MLLLSVQFSWSNFSVRESKLPMKDDRICLGTEFESRTMQFFVTVDVVGNVFVNCI